MNWRMRDQSSSRSGGGNYSLIPFIDIESRLLSFNSGRRRSNRTLFFMWIFLAAVSVLCIFVLFRQISYIHLSEDKRATPGGSLVKPSVDNLMLKSGAELTFGKKFFKGVDELQGTANPTLSIESNTKYVFIGGLQGSGSAVLSDLLQKIPSVNWLSLANMESNDIESQQPWLLNGYSKEYFYELHRNVGLEGKRVQTIYPQIDIIMDTNKNGIQVDEVKRLMSVQSGFKSRETLRQQWEPYWNMSNQVLLESTPENIIFPTYLQGAFGSLDSAFVFVLQHPLSWALRIRDSINSNYSFLESTRDLIALWLTVHQHLLHDFNALNAARIVHLESLATSRVTWLNLLSWLDKSQIISSDMSLKARSNHEIPFYLSRSIFGCVMCWLSGGWLPIKSDLESCIFGSNKGQTDDPPRVFEKQNNQKEMEMMMNTELQQDVTLESKAEDLKVTRISKPWTDPVAMDSFELHESETGRRLLGFPSSVPDSLKITQDMRVDLTRMRELQVLKDEFEDQINLFGYTFETFMALAKSGKRPMQIANDPIPRDSKSLGMLHYTSAGWHSSIKSRSSITKDVPGLIKLQSDSKEQPREILIAFHKYPRSDELCDEICLYMQQIVRSLIADMEYTVHLVSLEPQLGAPHSGMFGAGTKVRHYYGSMMGQIEQIKAIGVLYRLEAAIIFFTHLSVEVGSKFESGDSDWWIEPNADTHPFKELQLIRQLNALAHQASRIVVIGEIHHNHLDLAYLSHMNSEQAQKCKLWIERREKELFSMAHALWTKTNEDSDALLEYDFTIASEQTNTAHMKSDFTDESDAKSSEFLPQLYESLVQWVPYAFELRSESIPKLLHRSGQIFSGPKSALTNANIAWYLENVEPLLLINDSTYFGNLTVIGSGWEDFEHDTEKFTVEIKGILSDAEINHMYDTAAVFVMPMLENTGMSVEIVRAMSRGIPVVTTPFGIRGLGISEKALANKKIVLVANDAQSFADAITLVMTNETLWTEVSDRGMEHVRDYLSPAVQSEILEDAMIAIQSLSDESAEEIKQ